MKKIFKKNKLLLIIVVGVIAIAGFMAYSLNKTPPDKIEKNFIVKQGDDTRTIARNLDQEGIISSQFWFLVYAKLAKGTIQAGVYKLSSTMKVKTVYQELTGKASEYNITFPEGWRVTQIDAELAKKKIINAGDFLKIASGNEGYLFPDTYRFLPKSDPEEIRQAMLKNFEKKTADLKIDSQTIIIASIVEREAKFDEDRPKIAAVYLNRLAQGMKLEADPTIQYAKGSWDPIKASDYKNVISPYNTYLHDGLPPGPICNPGLKSIEAVVYPDQNDYLYFFHKSDGHAVYSKTLQEHQDNLKKYQ